MKAELQRGKGRRLILVQCSLGTPPCGQPPVQHPQTLLPAPCDLSLNHCVGKLIPPREETWTLWGFGAPRVGCPSPISSTGLNGSSRSSVSLNGPGCRERYKCC